MSEPMTHSQYVEYLRRLHPERDPAQHEKTAEARDRYRESLRSVRNAPDPHKERETKELEKLYYSKSPSHER